MARLVLQALSGRECRVKVAALGCLELLLRTWTLNNCQARRPKYGLGTHGMVVKGFPGSLLEGGYTYSTLESFLVFPRASRLEPPFKLTVRGQ